MAKFNSIFTSSLANTKDLLTAWQFQVVIDVSTSSPLTDMFKSDELLLRARTAKIPGKSFGVLETNFMNSKKKYKGKCTVDGQLNIEFDEFQDLYVTQVFHKWQQIMYNHGVKDDISVANGVTLGAGVSQYSADYQATITVIPYGTNNVPLDCSFVFYDAWPKEFPEQNLSMNEEGKVVRTVNFEYDYYELVANSTT